MSEPSDFTPYPVRRTPSDPPRAATLGEMVGRADSVQLRTELSGVGDTRHSTTIMTLRLTPTGSDRPVEVELRGSSITGTVRDGDWIGLADQRTASGRYEPSRLANLTTGAEVTVIGDLRTPAAKTARAVILVVFLAFFLAVLAFIIFGFIGASSFGTDF